MLTSWRPCVYNVDMTSATNINATTVAERRVAMNVDLTTVGGFTAARAAWKAAGCPANHPYLTTSLPVATIEPLVPGITAEMVAQAAAMKAAGLMPERKVW